mmetsp:Transcript_6809/g.14683  ORF Transcript_6809/g.14683 Transcript_6809/m.14683 type:complete len:476 (-) Transcript_6809:53-1480(-)
MASSSVACENIGEEISGSRKIETQLEGNNEQGENHNFLQKVSNLTKIRCSVSFLKMKFNQQEVKVKKDIIEIVETGFKPNGLRVQLPSSFSKTSMKFSCPNLNSRLTTDGCTVFLPPESLPRVTPGRKKIKNIASPNNDDRNRKQRSPGGTVEEGLMQNHHAASLDDKENICSDSNALLNVQPHSDAKMQCGDNEIMEDDYLDQMSLVSPLNPRRKSFFLKTSTLSTLNSNSSDCNPKIRSPVPFSTDRLLDKNAQENITPPNRNSASLSLGAAILPPPYSAENARYNWQTCYNTQYPDASKLLTAPHYQPIRSCLSSRKKPRNIDFNIIPSISNIDTPKSTDSKAVRFGVSCAAEFSDEQPPSILTPLPAEDARTRFPVEESPFSLDEELMNQETADNGALLAAWNNSFFENDVVDKKKKRRKLASTSKRRKSDVFGISGRSLVDDDAFDLNPDQGDKPSMLDSNSTVDSLMED